MPLRNLLFLIAEHASTRVLDAVTTLVLIRSLSVSSLGAFVVYQSWVALLLFLFPALENMLYREYGKHRQAGTLGRELAVYRKFNVIKVALAVVLLLVCALLPAGEIPWPRRLAAMALAFALPLAQSLYGIYRETLRFELKAGSVVVINALQRLGIILGIAVMGQMSGGSIVWIALVAVGIYVAFGVVWAVSVRWLLPQIPVVNLSMKTALPRIRASLGEAVIWIHLAGAVMGAVQTLDVYWLSRSGVSLGEIAIYSIALKAANFFQIIPLPFAQAFGVYLGRRSGSVYARAERRLVWQGMLLFAVLACVLFAFGSWCAGPVLAFLARGKFTPLELARAAEYFRYMLGGVALLSVCFAHGTYLSSRGSIRALTLSVHLPWLLFSVLGYALAASQGPLAAAKFNIPVAVFYTAGNIIFFLVFFRFAGKRSAKAS